MRKPRIIVPGVPHHLMLRGNNRRRLFSYFRDYRRMIQLICDSSDRHHVPVHCLCLMTNHLHLVATPDSQTSASAFVKSFAQRYAQIRNRERGGSGKLFEQRFRSVPIKRESQLAATLSYVELNPVRAGEVDEPEHYPWSTYRLHLNTGNSEFPRAAWTPSHWFLALGRAPADRARRYRQFVSSRVEPVHRDDVLATERASAHSRRRLERPNGESAI